MTTPVYHYTVDNREEFRALYGQIRYRSMLGYFTHPFSNPIGTYTLQVSGQNRQQIVREIFEAYNSVANTRVGEKTIDFRLKRVN